jgi:hypothetical protein
MTLPASMSNSPSALPSANKSSGNGFNTLRQRIRSRFAGRRPTSVYRPLKSSKRHHYFRVLHLFPSTEYEADIECTLHHVRLSETDCPSYETISYVWGDIDRNASIVVNHMNLSVPWSAVHALRRMRQPDSTRSLWIDAVCIDQMNDHERAQQVANMDQIYRHSRGNLIYLGEDLEAVGPGLQDIRSIHDEMMNESDGLRDIKGTVFCWPNPITRYASTAIRCVEDFTNVKRFFDLPWFTYVCPKFRDAHVTVRYTDCIVVDYGYFKVLSRPSPISLSNQR